MLKNLFDDRTLVDVADDVHVAEALGADKRICFVHLSDEVRPALFKVKRRSCRLEPRGQVRSALPLLGERAFSMGKSKLEVACTIELKKAGLFVGRLYGNTSRPGPVRQSGPPASPVAFPGAYGPWTYLPAPTLPSRGVA